MGCFWSSEGHEHCMHCNRRDVNNLVIIDHVCEICINRVRTSYSRGPKFGEYRCNTCRRFWSSRWCWPDKYQMCKQCKKPTLAFNYRDLKPTDTTNAYEDSTEHARELCQMCQQLGYPCKNFGKKYKTPASCDSKKKKHVKTTYTYRKQW